MEDSVPRTIEGAVLSIADKADSIAGMFALGLHADGSKDPFALRRQANGIVKTIAEHKLPVSLSQLFKDAREAYRGSSAEKKFVAAVDYSGTVSDFLPRAPGVLFARCFGLQLRRSQRGAGGGCGRRRGCGGTGGGSQGVLHLPEFQAIAAACKRMRNILKQAKERNRACRRIPAPSRLRRRRKAAADYVKHAPRVEAHQQKKDIKRPFRLFRRHESQWTHFSTKSWSWPKTSASGQTVWRCCKRF